MQTMQKPIALVLTSFVGLAVSFSVGLSAGVKVTAHPLTHQADNPAHSTPHSTPHSTGQHRGAHEHGSLEVPANQPLPSVKLIAHPDAKRGWNLEIQVSNFQFAPEQVNQTSLPTEGHAHLYINGVKLTRLYGNWYYLESLPAGEHEVTVSLNANGHEALMHNGQPIQSTVVIHVPVAAN